MLYNMEDPSSKILLSPSNTSQVAHRGLSEGGELNTREDVKVTPSCQINSRLFWAISGTANKSVT